MFLICCGSIVIGEGIEKKAEMSFADEVAAAQAAAAQ